MLPLTATFRVIEMNDCSGGLPVRVSSTLAIETVPHIVEHLLCEAQKLDRGRSN
jgi:hypothetical protein